ncbi:efflux RND transporter periplasmic adaptor subunit [Thiotrichales bacterium 19S9-12]|nr:efflux RND transporter periplasmic adaptor subunit [Thiotrichales bacterium 19S9-11]MCF6811880.1 efflux RND transporter periplasmic adaptor subunit [Thiotrichales bacterium 19S9-12]
MTNRFRKTIAYISQVLILLLVGMDSAFSQDGMHPDDQMNHSMPSEQSVAKKSKNKLKEGEIFAIIIPVNEADISSGVNAMIKKIYFRSGDSFKKGDTLLVFDCRSVEIDMKKAEAKLRATETAYKSSQELDQLEAISKTELEESNTQYVIAQAELESLEYRLSKCTIVAPYDGEVVAKLANENENVKVDDPLLSIVSSKDFEIQMFVPSIWLNWLKTGASFSLKLEEVAEPLAATIVKVTRRVDPASQSVVVYGKLDRLPDNIVAGMSGVATFEDDS